MSAAGTPAGGDARTIGFVGLGTMGKPMAANLVRAGLDVVVFDVEPAPVTELVELGARSGSLSEIAESCDLVEVAVWDSKGVEQVLVGDSTNGGILATARPGSIVIIHSTVSVATCSKVAESAAARGVRVLDAAMSGGQVRAVDGTLAILVGGDVADFDACKDVFEILGQEIFHVGPLGAGMTAKLCNNLMVLVNLEAVREAMALATAAGISAERMIELGSAGTADSWALRHGYALYEQAKGTPAFENQQGMQIKDLALAGQLARDLGVPGDGAIADFFQRRAQEC